MKPDNKDSTGPPADRNADRYRTILLASASPRRLSLLTEWGVEFRVRPATGVDESTARGPADSVARELAFAKAAWSRREEIAQGADESCLWVLGADTVVTIDGETLGKPRDEDHARAMLRRLSGRTHEVVTAVVVIPPSGEAHSEAEASTVLFRDLSTSEIDAYVASGDALGKAGAYGIQTAGRRLVAGFEGCYYTIVGLPMRLALRLLDVDSPPCDCPSRPGQRGVEGCGAVF